MEKEKKEQKYRKQFKGVVASDKGDKTAVVLVKRLVKHPQYHKYIQRSKRYRVHDPENKCTIGDTVVIEECKPVSKDKHFRVV